MKRNANFHLFWVMALLLLLAAVNIPRLNDQGLWGDEGWSVDFSDGSPRDVVSDLLQDRHPPLYFELLWAWRQLAGDSEVALRLLALFHSLLAGAFLYRLGRVSFHARVGAFALLLFALMDQQALWSQEVRQYPLLMLFAVMSAWALLAILRQEQRAWLTAPGAGLTSLREVALSPDRAAPFEGARPAPVAPVERPPFRGLYFCYVFALIGGLYTHSFMLLVWGAQLIFVLLVTLPHLRWRLLRLYALVSLAFAPWGLAFAYQFTQQGGLRHDAPLNWATAKLFTHNFLGEPVALMLGLLLLGLLSPWIGAPGWRRWHPGWLGVLYALLGILLPLGVVLGLTLLSDNLRLLTDRNLAIVLPLLALLMGVGMTAFRPFTRGLLVLFLLVNGLLTTDVRQQSPPWRAMAQVVAAHQVGEQPVFVDVFGEDAALRYHIRREVGDVPQVSLYQLVNDPAVEVYATLRYAILPELEGLWYLVWGEGEGHYYDALADWGYQRSATALDEHLGSPLYLYRYDSLAILDETRATFGETLTLHRLWSPAEISSGDAALPVALWWSAASVPEQDYTVSVFLLDAGGRLVAQHDSYPAEGQRPTGGWQPAELIFDWHRLPLPPDLPQGTYSLGIKVYALQDGAILRTGEGAEFFDAAPLPLVSDES